jgi:hypothetical protein
LAHNLEKRRALIWHQERILAYDLAKVLIHKPKVTVWMIMLPLLFLFFIQDLKKYKAAIGNFTDGFLKNKKIALDLALKSVREDISLEAMRTEWISESQPAAAEQPELFKKQTDEIVWLMNHFRRLLTAGGQSYEALIKSAYCSLSAYQDFIDTLFDLENAVIRTALTFNPPDENTRELVSLMQSAIRKIRQRERDRLFHG